MKQETDLPNWTEKYPVEALPKEIQYRFNRLLKIVAVNDEGFRTIVEHELTEPLFSESDSPIKQLRHITAHTFAIAETIKHAQMDQLSVLQSYDYEKDFPELENISIKDRYELLTLLDHSIKNLYITLQEPEKLTMAIKKPYQRAPITVADAFVDLSEHFYLHAQNMIDYYEKFSISRSESMKKALG